MKPISSGRAQCAALGAIGLMARLGSAGSALRLSVGKTLSSCEISSCNAVSPPAKKLRYVVFKE
jgi:hypothetical protein